MLLASATANRRWRSVGMSRRVFSRSPLRSGSELLDFRIACSPKRAMVRSRRGLHPHLRGQQGPNALRSLPEARSAGRIRHRGKRLQAHRREPIQTVGTPLVESGCQCRAHHQMLPRKQPLARLPRLEGLPRCSRLTKENGMHHSPPHSASCRTRSAGCFADSRAADASAQDLKSSA